MSLRTSSARVIRSDWRHNHWWGRALRKLLAWSWCDNTRLKGIMSRFLILKHTSIHVHGMPRISNLTQWNNGTRERNRTLVLSISGQNYVDSVEQRAVYDENARRKGSDEINNRTSQCPNGYRPICDVGNLNTLHWLYLVSVTILLDIVIFSDISIRFANSIQSYVTENQYVFRTQSTKTWTELITIVGK